jgi:outer membrane protein assembly factor BamA
VTYGKISIEPLTTVKGLRVSVAIEEGSSYSLGKVAVSGTMSLNEKLAEVAALKPGDLANFEAFREGQEKIHQAMRNAGYMKVSSEMHRELDDAKKVVDIRFEVAPGPEFHFGKLLIAGLDIHGEHEVRRLWGMDAGKRFNASYPNHFLAKLQEDNVFENLGEGTRAEFKLNDAEETVDVTLRFAAPKPAAKIK